MEIQFLLTLILFCYMPNASTSLFDWLFGKDEAKNERASTSGMKFELGTGDQRFLQLKDVLDNMSPLDACYNIVVFKLKKRCGELSEEELGKVSVQLLNCQSSVEERPIFPCTDHMSIAECTKDMDSTTWNSYQIVSNRARALCYATQQQQFRQLTQHTVNQLVSTAHGQLEYMKELQEGQEQLHSMTTDTVRKLYESQTELVSHQQTIRSSQEDVIRNIHNSMEELTKEKAMIATGNTELAKLTYNIREKLDRATEQLKKQEDTQLESHSKILDDLTTIQNKSHDALNKLDESSKYLMKNHKELLSHYSLMYDNMKKINSTVSHLLSTVNTMQEHLDDRINWFSHLLNLADDKLSLLTCGACHLGYFLFAALAASFLGIPSFSRVTLLMIVAINAVMETQSGHSLDFSAISVFMVIICAVNWTYVWWCRKGSSSPSAFAPMPGSIGSLPSGTAIPDSEGTNQPTEVPPLSPLEIRQLTTTLGRLYTSLNDSIGRERGEPPGADSSGDHHGSSSVDNAQPSTSAFTPVIRSSRPQQMRPDSSTMQDDVAKVRRYLEDLEEQSSVSSYSPSSHHSTPRYRPSSSVSAQKHSFLDINQLYGEKGTSRQRSGKGAIRRRLPLQKLRWEKTKLTIRASTSTTRSVCQGLTKSGTPCRLSASTGSVYCHRHVRTAS